MNNNKARGISGFILKIIGFIFMTLDHIGVFCQLFGKSGEFVYFLRILGRIALPIFVFLIVEGVRHTKSFSKYFARLAILEGVILIAQIIVANFISKSAGSIQSPIIDLLVVSLTIYLLNRKDKYSFLALIPIAYSFLSYWMVCLPGISKLIFIPSFLLLSSPVFSVALGIGFYYSEPLASLFLKSNPQTESLDSTEYHRYASNIISALFILILSIGTYLIARYKITPPVFFDIQIYSTLAMIPIFFYSGERGYNEKWFQYGAYLYFPLHLVIIYLIFVIL